MFCDDFDGGNVGDDDDDDSGDGDIEDDDDLFPGGQQASRAGGRAESRVSSHGCGGGEGGGLYIHCNFVGQGTVTWGCPAIQW